MHCKPIDSWSVTRAVKMFLLLFKRGRTCILLMHRILLFLLLAGPNYCYSSGCLCVYPSHCLLDVNCGRVISVTITGPNYPLLWLEISPSYISTGYHIHTPNLANSLSFFFYCTISVDFCLAIIARTYECEG